MKEMTLYRLLVIKRSCSMAACVGEEEDSSLKSEIWCYRSSRCMTLQLLNGILQSSINFSSLGVCPLMLISSAVCHDALYYQTVLGLWKSGCSTYSYTWCASTGSWRDVGNHIFIYLWTSPYQKVSEIDGDSRWQHLQVQWTLFSSVQKCWICVLPTILPQAAQVWWSGELLPVSIMALELPILNKSKNFLMTTCLFKTQSASRILNSWRGDIHLLIYGTLTSIWTCG